MRLIQEEGNRMREATMSSESTEARPSDPPESSGGTTSTSTTADETIATDPPENSGGGS